MVTEKSLIEGLNKGSLSMQTSTSTHTQKAEGEVAESAMSDRICPLNSQLYKCKYIDCAWFDFHNDACAILAISRILNSSEEWERDRT